MNVTIPANICVKGASWNDLVCLCLSSLLLIFYGCTKSCRSVCLFGWGRGWVTQSCDANSRQGAASALLRYCKWKNDVESMYVALEQWFYGLLEAIDKTSLHLCIHIHIPKLVKEGDTQGDTDGKTLWSLVSCPRRVWLAGCGWSV